MASIDESPAPNNEEMAVSEPKSNGVASALTFIAVMIFIIGFFIGIASLFNGFYNGIPWLILGYWVSAFVLGMLFLGFAEIIKLLQKISDK